MLNWLQIPGFRISSQLSSSEKNNRVGVLSNLNKGIVITCNIKLRLRKCVSAQTTPRQKDPPFHPSNEPPSTIPPPPPCLPAYQPRGYRAASPPSEYLQPPTAKRRFSTTPITLKKTANPRPNDLAKWAKSEKIRIENLEKRKERKKELLSSRIDPVLGADTEFVESFDVQPPPLPPVDWACANGVDPLAGHTEKTHLNHYLTPEDLAEALERSRRLTKPYIDNVTESGSAGFVDCQKEEALVSAHEEAHNRAVTAIQRIASLSIGSRSDKMRVQKARCIDLFGRHVTDRALPQDPGAPDPTKSNKTPRAGPDTGSSEVQIAILTVKIRNLARHLELKGPTDKHNKRNLRLLVHKRQKLLKYLKRKEKGGIRWRNVMEAIGLDDGAVQGEIMMR